MLPRQNTPEWLEWRKTKIGSSDAPIIMGVSPFKTPLTLWKEKKGLLESPPPSPQMLRGQRLEETAREAYQKFTGHLMFPATIQAATNPWMIASLDGMTLAEDRLLEIKVPGEKDHEIAAAGSVPDKYYPQLQHAMAVARDHFSTPIDSIDYFSWSEDNSYLITVDYDEEYCLELLQKEEEFWELLKGDTPPALSASDYVEAQDREWLELEEEVHTEWLIYSEAKKSYEELADKLKEKTNTNTRGKYCTFTVCNVKGAVDYSSIPELKGVDLEAYRKPSRIDKRIRFK